LQDRHNDLMTKAVKQTTYKNAFQHKTTSRCTRNNTNTRAQIDNKNGLDSKDVFKMIDILHDDRN
jgi:hypothetical protein